MNTDAITKRQALAKTLSRRQVADLLGMHQDSVTRALPDGLAATVISWGGHGKRMVFSQALVLRWDRARSCRRGHTGGPCTACRMALEDCHYVAEHLLEARHGVFERCSQDDCGLQEASCAPCGGV